MIKSVYTLIAIVELQIKIDRLTSVSLSDLSMKFIGAASFLSFLETFTRSYAKIHTWMLKPWVKS